MADVEQLADVGPPAEVTEAPAPEPDKPAFDESLLIRVKDRVVEPQRPDDTERNLLVSKLQAEITKNSDRIREIKAIVEEKRGSAKFATAGSSDVVRRLQGYRNEFQSVLRQKQHIREELQAVTKERDELREAKRALQAELRADVKIFNVDAIDSRLQELESKLNHESFNIQDENAMRAQVKKLTAARPKIAEMDAISAKLQENDQIRGEIIDRLKSCDEVLNGIKAKEEKDKAALDAIKAKGDDKTADVPTLNVEKQECYDIIVACRDKIASIRDEFSKKWEEYIKLDRNYKAWRNWDRKQKYEQRAKEREERNKQRAAEYQERRAVDLFAAPDPFESEIFLCDQAVVFLRKFLASDESASKAEAKAVEAPAPGMVLFKRKGDDDLESMFTGLGKKGKGKKAEKPAAEKKVADKKFSHDLDTLKIFMSIGVPAPNSTSEVQKTLDAVIAKKAEYQEKQAKAKEDLANGVVPHANGKDANGDADEEAEPGTSGDAEDGAEPAAAEDGEEPAAAEDGEEPAAAQDGEEPAAAEDGEEPATATADENGTAADAEEKAEEVTTSSSTADAKEEPEEVEVEEKPAATAAATKAAEEQPADADAPASAAEPAKDA